MAKRFIILVSKNGLSTNIPDWCFIRNDEMIRMANIIKHTGRVAILKQRLRLNRRQRND